MESNPLEPELQVTGSCLAPYWKPTRAVHTLERYALLTATPSLEAPVILSKTKPHVYTQKENFCQSDHSKAKG